ncbi:MAG: type I-E CRISPR-associated protein Cas5/CasD [Azospirillaceae bacterium]|nr:type I-E CRISPR-associated protein Cas5/CasD [Azospirillaceae bacterium]
MTRFLTFGLVAPLASFGAIAVGELRTGWDRPARSAVLGLVGACLGLDRDDDEAQAALATGYSLALLCHAPGRLLADFHTTQVPSTRKGRRFATRAAELAEPRLNTILTRRDYRSGAWHLGALWPRDDAPRWTLEALAAAMRRPVFVPYLGRKSCPLGLPLGPVIESAADAPAALEARHRSGPETVLREPGGWLLRDALADAPTATIIVLDADDPAATGPRHRRTEFRRDQPRSRRRWQFDLRAEAVLAAAQP